MLKEHSEQYRSNSHIPLSPRFAEEFGSARLAFSWQFSDHPWKREKRTLGDDGDDREGTIVIERQPDGNAAMNNAPLDANSSKFVYSIFGTVGACTM